ncbi:hypothetical protein JOQ06_005379, partial [Pogonophryne albipinna]
MPKTGEICLYYYTHPLMMCELCVAPAGQVYRVLLKYDWYEEWRHGDRELTVVTGCVKQAPPAPPPPPPASAAAVPHSPSQTRGQVQFCSHETPPLLRMEAFFNEWLWKEEYWLPPGISWQDTEMKEEEGRFPRPRDLLFSLPLAVAFIALRYVFERCFADPLRKLFGVEERVRIRVVPIPKLETFYTQNTRLPSQSDVLSLGKQSGLSQRKIQTWFRHRRNQDRPSRTKKFWEATWRFVFYLAFFTGGLSSLINTSWFWDPSECWRDYPKQPVADAHYWYYMLEMSFYLSLLLCVSVDVKRKV